MHRHHREWVLAAMTLAACAGEAAHEPVPAKPRPSQPASSLPAAGDLRCEAAAWQALTLGPGETAAASSGLIVHFEGTSHDHYADGHTDLLLALRFDHEGQSQRWLPSAFAEPRAAIFLDHCLRVKQADATRLVIEVAPLPRAKPDD